MAYEKMVDLVLTGDVMPGFDLLSVKSSLARTFKRSAVEVEHLFTSVPFTVKRDLPESQLQGYLDLFANIGAVVRIAPASSAVALIGAHAAKPDDAPLGGTTARRAPPPFTATEPLGPEAGDAADPLSGVRHGHAPLCAGAGGDGRARAADAPVCSATGGGLS